MSKATNVVWHEHKVGRQRRQAIKDHKSCIVWFTGLPSSGKSTIANELEHTLNNMGVHTYVLDGDNVRYGLNKNLGFSKEDREENIRRIGEVAKLFVDAGILPITAFISPYRKDRQAVRDLMKEGEFVEVYVKCPVAVCMDRDPKGLYKKAIAGEIKDFTGVNNPYEEPLDAEVVIETDKLSVGESVDKILDHLISRAIIGRQLSRGVNGPYGSKGLINNVAEAGERDELLKKAPALKHVVVADRFLSDCEMLAIGAFSPLCGFMNKEEVDEVVRRCMLPDGLAWGVPIILTVDGREAESIKAGDEIALCDAAKNIIAIMAVSDTYRYPKDVYCKGVFGTEDTAHPGVKMMMDGPDTFLAGEIKLVNRPQRSEVASSYYLDPRRTREEFKKRGWSSIVAFQTRNPIHRAHEYLIKCALESVDGALIHPLVGETKPDDIPAGVRMKCYEALLKGYFNPQRIVLSVLPTFMRYAGPREAINHAIIRKNYGCTHFIIGRDHAGVGTYYGPFEAQELLVSLADRIGITPIKFDNSFYCKRCGNMASAKTCSHDPAVDHLQLSGTKVRAMLKEGSYPPEEFSRKEVVDVLIEWARK